MEKRHSTVFIILPLLIWASLRVLPWISKCRLSLSDNYRETIIKLRKVILKWPFLLSSISIIIFINITILNRQIKIQLIYDEFIWNLYIGFLCGIKITLAISWRHKLSHIFILSMLIFLYWHIQNWSRNLWKASKHTHPLMAFINRNTSSDRLNNCTHIRKDNSSLNRTT